MTTTTTAVANALQIYITAREAAVAAAPLDEATANAALDAAYTAYCAYTAAVAQDRLNQQATK